MMGAGGVASGADKGGGEPAVIAPSDPAPTPCPVTPTGQGGDAASPAVPPCGKCPGLGPVAGIGAPGSREEDAEDVGRVRVAEGAGLARQPGPSSPGPSDAAVPATGLFLKSYLVTVSRGGPRARPEPVSPSPDLGLHMDRAPTYPPTPSPIGGNHAHCGNGGDYAGPPGHGWHKGGQGTPSRAGTRGGGEDEDEADGEKGGKAKRKKKKRKKEAKEGGGGGTGGKWTFGALFRRRGKKKGEEEGGGEEERAKESTEEEGGGVVPGRTPARNTIAQPVAPKRSKEEEEYLERLGHPCVVHNGCSGCTGHVSRGRYRPPAFGSGSDCGRDQYGGCGSALVRRDSSTSSHKERRELIKARVEAMRERLPRDSSSEEEVTPGGSVGSWDAHRSRRGPPQHPGVVGGHPPLPAGSVGSAGSSPYLGRRSKIMGRTERFHQRRLSRDYREDGDEEETWRRRPNGLPPQGISWRASQSDAEAAYIGCLPGPNVDFGGLGSGSALSHSPGPSPMNSPLMGGRRSVSSAAGSSGYAVEGSGMRSRPRRYPSTPISPQSYPDGHVEGRAVGPPQSAQGFPTRSRSTDLLLCWRPEEGTSYHVSEPNPFHFPSPTAQRKAAVQRPTQDANQYLQHLNARWPSTAPCRSPPPPPPPRDPQRRINPPPQCYPPRLQMRDGPPHHDPGAYVTRKNFHHSQNPPHLAPQHQPAQENPYVNVVVHKGRPSMALGPPQGVQACLADAQPRSRRPLRVTQSSGGYYPPRSTEASYMSDSQVGSPQGRKQVHPILMQHPPLESHFAVPFLAESPPPRCVINRVLKDPPHVAEGVVHSSRPLMRQQRLPVLNRSRSSSPAPAPPGNRPPHLHIRPLDGFSEGHSFAHRGHSSAPQTPIDGPINRPLSIVSEEKGDVSPRIPPVPPARSSSRRSSISSLEALEYGVWGVDRPTRSVNKGPSGLEDALTELENIYKSLKFEDDQDGETDSNLMGSSEQGLTYDDQDRPFTDDMAYRRLHSKEKTSPSAQHNVGGVVAQAGSYLLVSPTLGPADPWTDPPPNSINPGEPDITLDDVVYRSVRQANAHISQDPQPLFGIPLGPVTRAADSDYLHVKPPSPSPTTRAASKRTPDVVKDDLAFRSLRKDRTTYAQPVRPVPLRGVSSPPPRPSSSFSGISSPPPLPTPTLDFQAIRKKRAVRSLSANLLGILQTANVSARPMSPPLASRSVLPPQSPPSPRREAREALFPPASPAKPTSCPQSPSKQVTTNLSLAHSEDSESGNVVNTATGQEATSSDTLTEGHAEESKPKQSEAREAPGVDQPKPLQSTEESPGEIYEALGRVLSKVTKETDTPVKETKLKGTQDDDLETLLVALAREARATSENLGRELDQLKTSTIKMTEELRRTHRRAGLGFEEVDDAFEGFSKDSSSNKTRPIDSVPGEEILRTKEYLLNRSSSPGRVGAIASLALRELEKPRTLSSSSSPDSTKLDGLSVVVGKCTVGKDSNHPGSIVSFTSSVGPIKSDAKHPSGRIDDSNALGRVSTSSVDSPMEPKGGIPNAKCESDGKRGEVSAASASVPIKSGSSSFEVGKGIQGGLAAVEPVAEVDAEEGKKYNSEVSHLKDADRYVNSMRCFEEKQSTLRIVSKAVEDVCIREISRDERSLPLTGTKGEASPSIESKSKEHSKEPSPTETTPITGSMRLVVRKDPEHSNDPAFKDNLQQCSWVVRSEPDPGDDAHRTLPKDLVERNADRRQSYVEPNEKDREYESEVRCFGKSFVASESSQAPTTDAPRTQCKATSAVVEEIQKEFDQLLFSIPAKKAKTSDEKESSKEFTPAARPRLAESKSLEHPRRTGKDAKGGHEGLRKAFPKTLGGSSSFAKSTTGVFRSSSDADKVELVSTAFEREFEELWKSTIEKDCKEMDGRVGSDRTTGTAGPNGALDQLRAGAKPEAPEGPSRTEGAAEKDPPEPDEKEVEGEVGPPGGEREASFAAHASAACAIKTAVAAAPACLTLDAICYPCKTASGESDSAPDTSSLWPSSSLLAGMIPEPGDPLFTALAAFLALVSLIAALIVHP
ncbi:uncharacterized protein [Hetaerina americana]|uniref:uncharacterized protein n=1 Tax=Hetaerina americana TaxID=62018 RepID=UPI003A7F62AC